MILILSVLCTVIAILMIINRIINKGNYSLFCKMVSRIIAVSMVFTGPIILYFINSEMFLYCYMILFAFTIILLLGYCIVYTSVEYRNIKRIRDRDYDRIQLLEPNKNDKNV